MVTVLLTLEPGIGCLYQATKLAIIKLFPANFSILVDIGLFPKRENMAYWHRTCVVKAP